jgi:Mg2+ and Co2+ transporter CorA
LRPRALDVIGGRDWVVTIHDGPLAALQRIEAANEGETRLGALDAATFFAAVADEVLADYLGHVEELERQIDVLDERALRGRGGGDVLVAIVRLRGRMGAVRRTLAPHRAVFTGLSRPEIELHPGFGRPWPGLADRLERTLDAVENVRELLLGTFDIYMGRTAQDANDVVKILTLVSAILLPSVVLAGIMGMNFRLPLFEEPANVWLVIGAMAILAVAILGAAKWRRWI